MPQETVPAALRLSSWHFRNNNTITHNYFFDLGANEHTSRVYGNLTLSLLDRNTGEVKLGIGNNSYIDTYNFNRQEGGNTSRNIATWIARRVVGEGTPFNIYGYGKNPKIFVY